MRSRIAKWLKVMLIGGALVAALGLGGGSLYEQTFRRRMARAFPPDGVLLEIDGRLSHIICAGEGSPTVILEAGGDSGGSFAWATVFSEIAEISRTCSYDRAGMLWSDRRTEPRDAYLIADELHALLATAGERPPYVMVGHSLGGPLIRVFDARFEGEAEGFVFVDSSHPEQFQRLPAEVRQQFEQQLKPPSPAQVALRTLGIMRLKSSTPQDARAAHFIRNMPGFMAEVVAYPTILAQAAQTGSLGERPTVVLTAGTVSGDPGWSEELRTRVQKVVFELHAELTALSTNSEQRIITTATHYIQVDSPSAVIDAVRDVVTAIRDDVPLSRVPEN